MKTKNKSAYDIQYAAEHLRQIRLSLNDKTDGALIEWLDRQPNKQGYLKELIRKDMKKSED